MVAQKANFPQHKQNWPDEDLILDQFSTYKEGFEEFLKEFQAMYDAHRSRASVVKYYVKP